MTFDADEASALADLRAALQGQARAAGHRLTLVLAGDPDWSIRAALAALGDTKLLWLTDRPVPCEALPLRAAAGLLGQQCDGLVYDAHSGFDPDGFGAASGALSGGSILLILTPRLADWPSRRDPQAERIAVHPYTPDEVGGRFIARLARVLASAPGCCIVRQNRASRPLPPSPRGAAGYRRSAAADTPATDDQQAVIDAIVKAAHGRARRPLVITADRGRGKSAALGLAAARLLTAGTASILVTAPRRAAVEPLFRHALAALPDARSDATGLRCRGREVRFLPPDALVQTRPPADLLLVDEAAGIPVPLLTEALTGYPRVVFATTIHGYEGAGRGFEVRFRATLDRLTPNWRRVALDKPIRWACGDPLEALTARALLLDANPADAEALAGARPRTCDAISLDRDRLAHDEQTLRELFGLLVLAHYQTRPFDLRHLLDGPGVRVQALQHGRSIAATLLTADEGGFDSALCEAVFAGRRRPRGHLLPQTLAAHAGFGEAPLLQYRRIIRIAVHPAAQGRGLGRQLIDTAITAAAGAGCDLIGASFGATPELLRFWTRCGFAPVQLGTRRNNASGDHALVVLCALRERGSSLLMRARQRFVERLPRLLPGPFRRVRPDLIAALLAELPGQPPGLDASARRELTAFAHHHRSLEASLAPLQQLSSACLGPALAAAQLSSTQASLIVHAVLQMRDPAAVPSEHNGRAQNIADLRQAIGILLKWAETRQVHDAAAGKTRHPSGAGRG